MQLEIALFCLDRLIVVVVVEQRSWSSSLVVMQLLVQPLSPGLGALNSLRSSAEDLIFLLPKEHS